jgi:hypothetical protein
MSSPSGTARDQWLIGNQQNWLNTEYSGRARKYFYASMTHDDLVFRISNCGLFVLTPFS